jgi:hypothetical protein
MKKEAKGKIFDDDDDDDNDEKNLINFYKYFMKGKKDVLTKEEIRYSRNEKIH